MSDNEFSADPEVAPGDDGVDLGPSLALATLVLGLPAMIIGVVLFALIPGPWWLGILLGLGLAVAMVWLRVRNADQRILAELGGGLLQADGSVRLENMVQSLSLAGGVEAPDVVILSDQARNAMAIRSRGNNRLVITQGLLQNLEVVELEGVVAELLTRLRNGDAESATIGAALFGQPIIDGPLGAVLGPLAEFGLGRLLRDDRDLEADRQAVRLTRYPPGLLSALRVMAEGEIVPKASSDGLAHLWLVDPRPAVSGPAEAHRAPLDLRIDVLAEL